MSGDWNSNGDSLPVTAPDAKASSPAINNGTHLNDISVNVSKDLIAAAGFNVETPIVNALIGNLTGALPTKKREGAETFRCDVCDCEMSSNVILGSHINGSRHKKRLKALDIIAQIKAGGKRGVHVEDSDNPNAFRCEVCCLTVNSAQQLEFHLSGAKHKKKAAKAGIVDPESNDTLDDSVEILTPPSAKKKKKEEPKVLTCDVCNVIMNSQIQYDQHLTSKKHLNKTNPSRHNQRRFMHFKGGGTQHSNSNYQNDASQNKKSLVPFNFVNAKSFKNFSGVENKNYNRNNFNVSNFREQKFMSNFLPTQQY